MMETEHSERARHVTEQVSLWIQNDGEYHTQARTMVDRPDVLRDWLSYALHHAPRGSAPWQVAQELAPNDYGRIHWDDIADALRGK